ncbi:FeoB-associated Cys-rich membrane protein [Caproiciproducens galactitolivorans]|uniref:FeoB-associated Cys-rich membrane protein n=1 Tax=Caproiciproducens galactitolivorans TaxID=642589 RepID=UPI001083F65F|nr:FeoB-associated Cys-rich membrane protein [Caproiciproducens galactitolivorans]QEY34457.1 FeoB-associated Cys-rich membrane protein [Caproiciproducens galactitolivorans]
MLQWLAANAATIIICAILGILFVRAICYLHKTRKNGGCAGCGGCSGDCCHCAQAFRKQK